MDLNNYLLRNVKPEEFEGLKSQEQEIIALLMADFNDTWKPKVADVKTAFKYNPKRALIGIYVERDGQQHLAADGQGLSEFENTVVRSLYGSLERRLDRIRLPNEQWADTVSTAHE